MGILKLRIQNVSPFKLKNDYPVRSMKKLEFYELTRATFLTECQGIKIRMLSNSSLKVWLHLKRDFLFKIIFNSLNDVT